MLGSASIVLLLGVLLSGNAALGLAGVAAHHGLISLPAVWLFGLLGKWARRAMLWRLRHRAEAPTPTWKTTLKHITVGGTKATLLALLTPVAGYAWAHVLHILPAIFGWALPLFVVGAALWTLHRRGVRWPLSEQQQEKARLALGSPWMSHALWLVVAPLWSPPTPSVDALLTKTAERSGFTADVESFHWVDEPYGGIRTAFTSARGVVLSKGGHAPADVFLVRIALSHDGQPTRILGTYNLSNTASVAEAQLSTWRKWLAWTIEHDGQVRSIEIADLRGEVSRHDSEWPALSRAQGALTNRQQTGQWRGIGRSSVILSDTPRAVKVTLNDGKLVAELASRTLELDLGRTPTAETLGSSVIYRDVPPPRPGALVPWAVDRLRAVSWIGSDGMQWVKGWVFRASEQLEELENQVVGIDPDETISEELGDLLERLPLAEPGGVPGWPPAPIEPLLQPALTGEGRWVSLGQDMLIRGSPGLPSPFLFTFVRTDTERAYIQTSITLWDPRQVELHILAGTEEPKSMTGEVGSGTIPRDPVVLNRLVGAFNGAFQAVHGEFGMMESRRLQLPPKPYAATVTTHVDGTAGFGTWPLSAPIPADVVSLRQNLTPLIADGKLNPYRRTWWGGVPEGWTEETRTVRSGLCLTEEGFIAYFYSPGITPDALGKAMLQTRCSYGMHLDMNAGHTGFEFYRVAPEAELPALGRPLDKMWEARGRIPDVEGLHFFSRLMVRKMPLMNFPRYIYPTSRDFFYLTQRPLLPGTAVEPLLPDDQNDGKWRLVDVGQAVFPPPVAMTRLRVPAGNGVSPAAYVLTRLDPKELVPSEQNTGIAALEAPKLGSVGLWLDGGAVRVAGPAPSDEARLLARGERSPSASTASALCVDRDGMLVLIRPEVATRASSNQPSTLAAHIGCSQTLYVESPASLLFGETLAQASKTTAAKDTQQRTWLSRRAFSGVRRIFPDTPFLPPDQWALIQRRRVEYSVEAER